tara:strand:+ start:1833 stop:2414 length:582 start_codon:yes stop_codon:yes gene_type:complete
MSTNRGMSGALTTTTENITVQYYELVYIDVNNGYYLTNAPFDIVYDSQTYDAAGNMLELDGVEENVGFEIESLTVNIGGINPLPGDGSDPFIKKILVSDYVDRSVVITRVYYQDDAIVDGVVLYSGFINAASAASGLGQDGAAVSLQTSNNWTDFSKLSSRHTNSASQQSAFPGDLGFEFAKEVQKQVEWKEA